MVLKTIGFLSVMMSTAMTIISFWTFCRAQNDLDDEIVLSKDSNLQSHHVTVVKINSDNEISRAIARVLAVVTGSLAFLQIIYSGYLLSSKSEEIMRKSKSWMIFTLAGASVSWVVLAVILILQINGQETTMKFVSFHNANLLDCFFHMLAVFAFVHTVELTLLSEFLKFFALRFPLNSEPELCKSKA